MKTLLIAALVVAASVAQAQTFQARESECIQNRMERSRVSRADAANYCRCLVGSFSRRLSPEEASLILRRPPDWNEAESARVIYIIGRSEPQIIADCGR